MLAVAIVVLVCHLGDGSYSYDRMEPMHMQEDFP